MYGVADWFIIIFVNKPAIAFSFFIIIVPNLATKFFEIKNFEKKYFNKKLLKLYKCIIDLLFFIPTIVWVISLFKPNIYDQLGRIYDNIVKGFLFSIMCITFIVISFVLIIFTYIVISYIRSINKKNRMRKKTLISKNKSSLRTNNYTICDYGKLIDKINLESNSVKINCNENIIEEASQIPLQEKIVLNDLDCSLCDGTLIKKRNRYTGEFFYGCTNFRITRCKCTMSINDYNKIIKEDYK